MRLSLVGPESNLWQTSLPAACILAGSIPSGNMKVLHLRERVSALMLGPGFGGTSFSTPTVVHSVVLARELPSEHIFVGSCTHKRLSSPWLDPSQLPGSAINSFSSYVAARADLKEWLAPLSDQVLVCDCALNENCHALYLQRVFAEQFDKRTSHAPSSVQAVSNTLHSVGARVSASLCVGSCLSSFQMAMTIGRILPLL